MKNSSAVFERPSIVLERQHKKYHIGINFFLKNTDIIMYPKTTKTFVGNSYRSVFFPPVNCQGFFPIYQDFRLPKNLRYKILFYISLIASTYFFWWKFLLSDSLLCIVVCKNIELECCNRLLCFFFFGNSYVFFSSVIYLVNSIQDWINIHVKSLLFY
jgi:hypothetical protein